MVKYVWCTGALKVVSLVQCIWEGIRPLLAARHDGFEYKWITRVKQKRKGDGTKCEKQIAQC